MNEDIEMEDIRKEEKKEKEENVTHRDEGAKYQPKGIVENTRRQGDIRRFFNQLSKPTSGMKKIKEREGDDAQLNVPKVGNGAVKKKGSYNVRKRSDKADIKIAQGKKQSESKKNM